MFETVMPKPSLTADEAQLPKGPRAGIVPLRATPDMGFQDIVVGCRQWRLWLVMAWAETRRRYRRTLIGPFWSSLSVAISLGAMGTVFSLLWNQPIQTFMPFMSAGMMVWSWMSVTMTESCGMFVAAETVLKQIPLPYTAFACNLVARNVIAFFHHLLVFVLVVIGFSVPVTWDTLLVVPAILLVMFNGVWVSLMLGVVATRFRDVSQLMGNLLQICMFVTPIMWKPEQLGPRTRFLADYNPIFHFVDIVRAPMLGTAPALESWIVVATITCAGWVATVLMMNRYRRYIIYWL
jgi:lipopolysaccharide transport system permease protein